MRHVQISLLCLVLLAGCSGGDRQPSGRVPLRIDDCAIRVAAFPGRSYMQSDREGAFLTGSVGGSGDGDMLSVAGTDVVRGIRVERPEGVLVPGALDSALIRPYETIRYYRGGISVALAGLEGCGGPDVHGFVVRVKAPHAGRTILHVTPGPGSPLASADRAWGWKLAGGGTLCAAAGGQGVPVVDGVSVDGDSGATFLVCTFPAAGGRGEPPRACSAVWIRFSRRGARACRIS